MGICTAQTIDLLSIDQEKTKKKRLKGGKGYVLKKGLTSNTNALIKQVFKIFNELLSSLGNIFKEIDKLRGKLNSGYVDTEELKLSHVFIDFHNNINRPFEIKKYNDELNTPPEEKDVLSQKTLNYVKKLRLKRQTQLNDIFGKTVSMEKFKKSKYIKILKEALESNKESLDNVPKLTLPSRKRKLTNDISDKVFSSNFAELYNLLIRNMKRLAESDNHILAIVKEENIHSKLLSKFTKETFNEAKELLEIEKPNETPKNKHDLLPNYLAKLLINRCVSVIKGFSKKF